ncbi:hypothetical protein [Variovorax sp. E3]|uniref:hypothetical protein n=1 Tax=Variovorax sp. E3 TaxID=1914993 RepID=UPI0027DD46E0|nr:hypothetical protein [Variovorax sp. E3]
MVGIDQGVPFVQVNGQRSTPGQPIQAGQWSHIAVKAEGDSVALYVGGRPTVSLAAKLPALNTAAAIGADVAPTAPAAANAQARKPLPPRSPTSPARSTKCACRRSPAPTRCCWPTPSRKAPSRA